MKLVPNPPPTTPPPDVLIGAAFGSLRRTEIRGGDHVCAFYEARWDHPRRAALIMLFYPMWSDPAGWQNELFAAEARALAFLAREHDALRATPRPFARLFKSYARPTRDIRDVIPDLRLTHVKLNTERDTDELIYDPCKWFPSFNLCVEINHRGRVKSAWFDG